MSDIAVIGAGISGLTTSKILAKENNVTIFEKSRGVGGRSATRRAEHYSFDHGAQFFTANTKEFANFVDDLLNQEIVQRWDADFVEIDDSKIISSRKWSKEYPHYVGVPGMNAIGKYLAENLDIRLNTKINAVSKVLDKWILKNDLDEVIGEYDWVIITAPPEQVSGMLVNNAKIKEQISDKKMSACYSLMVGFKESLPICFDAALVKNNILSWISINNSKPNRTNGFSILATSTNDWANQNITTNKEIVKDRLYHSLSRIINIDIQDIDHLGLHLWKYANIKKQNGKTYLLDTHKKLGVCGDWFIKGRIESAYLSGYHLGTKLKGLL